jgi:hypothetical protein
LAPALLQSLHAPIDFVILKQLLSLGGWLINDAERQREGCPPHQAKPALLQHSAFEKSGAVWPHLAFSARSESPDSNAGAGQIKICAAIRPPA